MKKLLLLSLFITLLIASKIEWQNYEKALKIAKSENKIIMIEAMSPKCHYCIEMEKDVLNNKYVLKRLKKYFIPVKWNINNKNLPINIDVYLTPTFIFVDKNGKILKKIPGAWKKEDFLMILNEIRKIK